MDLLIFFFFCVVNVKISQRVDNASVNDAFCHKLKIDHDTLWVCVMHSVFYMYLIRCLWIWQADHTTPSFLFRRCRLWKLHFFFRTFTFASLRCCAVFAHTFCVWIIYLNLKLNEKTNVNVYILYMNREFLCKSIRCGFCRAISFMFCVYVMRQETRDANERVRSFRMSCRRPHEHVHSSHVNAGENLCRCALSTVFVAPSHQNRSIPNK